MREIKFRAWDTKVKQPMWDHEGALSLIMLQGRVLSGDAVDDGHLERFKVMQYTGLKDKNGKEIYEGDVVMVINYLNGKPWEGHIHPCEVHFSCGKFELKNHWRSESLCNSTVEIIGNIYENPELVK